MIHPDLRRFGRHRLTRAALAVLAVVPLLYGAVYLAAFWDPYNKLDKIPVALVMEDRAAYDKDGRIVHAGQDLAGELQDRHVFGWIPASPAQAREGLRSGAYHLVFTIPAGFSQDLVDDPDPDRPAEQAKLTVESDDATNYLSGLLARSAFTEIRAAAASSASSRFFDRMLVGFTDLKSETGRAADGAAHLAAGSGQAENGADRIASGASDARQGSQQLAGGLESANQGAQELANGLATLDAGSAQLADGTAQAAAGGRQLATTVDKAVDSVEPALREHSAQIAQAATAIADGADAVADHLDALPSLADRTVARTGEVVAQLDALAAAHPDLANDAAFSAARQAAAQAAELAVTVRGQVGDVNRLAVTLRAVAVEARAVAEAAPHLADDIAAARAEVDRLAAGLDALSLGAQTLHEGTHKAAVGSRQLAGGVYRLSTGARQLDSGLTSLSAGTRGLATGLATLNDGAQRLADGLAGGADRIPGYDPDSRAERAGVLGDPVALRRDVRHAAATYGVGFAPYFVALALWVGAMLTFMVFKPLTRRNVLSGAHPWRVAVAAYRPAVAVGTAQAVILYLVLRYALGLVPVSPWATLGMLVLTAWAFAAAVQLLGAALGTPGRLAALALLMLQLTSSGGTYPVQTSPGFFQALSPFMPMTYVIAALRRLTVGGSSDVVWVAAGVLCGLTVGALALTALAARRARRLTVADLHPVLSM